jgi:maleate cis-trans isomerase
MTDNGDDSYGRRARIGYTSPPLTTEVFPYEFYQMVPAGVTLILTTLAIVARSKDEVDRSYDISMQAAREMAAAGVDIVVLGACGWGSAFNQIGRIPRHAALDMGRKLKREHPAADSLLLPSPHWPTAGVIEQLERELGINVMTAQQAIVWDALRRCGVNDPIPGFGRLLREF